MRTLITGAAGFIGSNLLRRLVSDGVQVSIFLRKDSNTWRIADVLDKVTAYDVDLRDASGVKKAVSEIQPEVIFHLATAGVYGGVAASDTDLIETNLLGFVNLVSALDEIPYKALVNTGSSSEYGIKTSPMKEGDLCEPMNTYGVTKLAATLYASFIAKTKNKPIVTLRVFSPYGPYDDHRRLVSSVCLALARGVSPTLANPATVRDFTYIDDLVELFLEAAEKAAVVRAEIFNAGSGREHTSEEVVNLIKKQIGNTIEFVWGATSPRPWESPKWEADTSNVFETFKWRPRYSLEEGIKKTAEWFTRNQSFYKL